MPSWNSKVFLLNVFLLKICVCKHWIYYFSSKWVFTNDFLVCSGNSMVHIEQCKQGNYWDLPSYVEAIEAFLLYGGLTCFCDNLSFGFQNLESNFPTRVLHRTKETLQGNAKATQYHSLSVTSPSLMSWLEFLNLSIIVMRVTKIIATPSLADRFYKIFNDLDLLYDINVSPAS